MAAIEHSRLQDTVSHSTSPIARVQSAPQLSDVNQVCGFQTWWVEYNDRISSFYFKAPEAPDRHSGDEGTDSSTKPSSSSHRPLTRSQTGTVFKRRRRDDSEHFDTAVPRKRAPPSRKRQKASRSPSDSATPEAEDSDSSPKPPTTREASLTASVSSDPVPSGGNQITFLHTSDPANGNAEPRLPRSRATLPTPIPNLTKKSRGRRVPTQLSTASDPDQKATRLYVCTVDGCGKCFHRGEHLKRHIRSIHTHEKRI